jgi:hypothetical protein
VKGGHTGIAELLLKSGAQPDLENSLVQYRTIPLLFAIYSIS